MLMGVLHWPFIQIQQEAVLPNFPAVWQVVRIHAYAWTLDSVLTIHFNHRSSDGSRVSLFTGQECGLALQHEISHCSATSIMQSSCVQDVQYNIMQVVQSHITLLPCYV